MNKHNPTRTAVKQMATDKDTAIKLLNKLDQQVKDDKITSYGVNTRTETLEIIHNTHELHNINRGNNSSERTQIDQLIQSFKSIGIDVQLMIWEPKNIIKRLSEYVGRDVQEGWYEDDEWCSGARDYLHAIYYLDEDDPTLLQEYQKHCQ